MSDIFEYKMLSINLVVNRIHSEVSLNELGKEGWELVSVTCPDGHIGECIFKRRIEKAKCS